MKLRTDYPEEYADAVKQAEEHLESPRKWRNSSSHRFSKDIISPVADGQKGMSRFLRPALGILLYPLAAPFLAIGMPLAGYEILLTVAVLMLHFFGGASVVNHLMAKKRYPERFKINRYLMEDLYGGRRRCNLGAGPCGQEDRSRSGHGTDGQPRLARHSGRRRQSGRDLRVYEPDLTETLKGRANLPERCGYCRCD